MSDNKYIDEDQFVYDEKTGKKGSLIKQDTEFFNDEDYLPGKLVHVKRIASNSVEDWKIFIDKQEVLTLKGSRFSTQEKNFLRTSKGLLFVIDGVKKGWSSVSEFKRQLQEIV